ncbi:MAG: dephospho-CoA kinase, partial [Planctomycetes bacterium]|nr:dephospho-CoA kinase [Planctomycetota bacterium]
GSGKSPVAEQFKNLSCAVINADQINHQILKLPEIIEKITQAFSQNILTNNGQIDRKALGEIVFQNEQDLKKLTDLLHPQVIEKEKKLLETYQKDPKIKAIVLDVPLLLEVDQHKWCDSLVFVESEEPLRIARLADKYGWNAQKVKKLENLQFSLDNKAKMSDYRVVNNSSILDLTRQVAYVLSRILDSNERRT